MQFRPAYFIRFLIHSFLKLFENDGFQKLKPAAITMERIFTFFILDPKPLHDHPVPRCVKIEILLFMKII